MATPQATEPTAPAYEEEAAPVDIVSGGNGAPLKVGNTATIVPIQDKTLYSKDQKVNGLLKALGSYTSVAAVS